MKYYYTSKGEYLVIGSDKDKEILRTMSNTSEDWDIAKLACALLNNFDARRRMIVNTLTGEDKR